MPVDYARISNTMGKMAMHLKSHNSICVSVSGGSDSNIIVHMIATYFRDMLPKVHFVFSDTGIEYRATYRHLDFMEEHYGIKIDRVRGVPIPVAIKENGVPWLSKDISDKISRLQKHGFDWEDGNFDCLNKKFPGCMYPLKWWCNAKGEGSRFNIDSKKGFKRFLLEKKLDIKISAECCHISKKKPLSAYEKETGADLIVSGERKSEGGRRATTHDTCFGERRGIDLFMPLFFWNDDTKAYYKQEEGIVYSDCYEVWGMKRTGCVGCPFARKRKEELEVMKKYEPNLYKACMNIFGESYRLTDEFENFRGKAKRTGDILPGQIDIEDYLKSLQNPAECGTIRE